MSALDYSGRFLSLSDTPAGYPSERDFIGTYAWDWALPSERDVYREGIMKVGPDYRVNYFSTLGFFRGSPKLIAHKAAWVGVGDVAIVKVAWEFPSALRILTTREMDVLLAIGHGQSVKEIAAKMQVKPATVYVHLASIRSKLGEDSSERISGIAHCFVVATGSTWVE